MKKKIFENKKQGEMNDQTGAMPKITSKQQALTEILYVVNDKRSHVMLDEAFDWLNLKMKIIGKLAKEGLKNK